MAGLVKGQLGPRRLGFLLRGCTTLFKLLSIFFHLPLIKFKISSYATLQAHKIVNVVFHREYSPGIVFV
jgi:hypothetical protein